MKEQNNDKLMAIVKLGLWLVFIIILIIIVNVGNKNKNINNPIDNNNKNDVEIVSFEDKIDKLSNNYKYKYEIKMGEEIYVFEGSKMDSKESGYRLKNNEYLYYFLENGYIYQVNNGGLDKIDNIYDNIDTIYLEIARIKESILNKEYTELDNKYSYILEDKTIDIYTNEENITKIEIIIEEDYYKLEFSDIGLIKEIKY